MTSLVDVLIRERSDAAFAAAIKPISHLLDDPKVAEIMLNPAVYSDAGGVVWVDVDGRGIEDSGVRISAGPAEVLIRTVASQAMGSRPLNADNPVVSCQAASGQFRFEGLIRPAVRTPTFTIRKYLKRDVALADYVSSCVLTETQAAVLSSSARNETILLGGQTFSGKTTMLNALLMKAACGGTRRLLIIEDTPEVEVPSGPSLRLEVSADSSFDYRHAVASALRQRPDAIILGELRKPNDTMQALNAWNTGHQGMGTVHAPSCTEMLWRLYSLCRESESGRHVQPRSVSSAVHMVVHLKRVGGRRVADVQRVVGWNESQGNFVLEAVV